MGSGVGYQLWFELLDSGNEYPAVFHILYGQMVVDKETAEIALKGAVGAAPAGFRYFIKEV